MDSSFVTGQDSFIPEIATGKQIPVTLFPFFVLNNIIINLHKGKKDCIQLYDHESYNSNTDITCACAVSMIDKVKESSQQSPTSSNKNTGCGGGSKKATTPFYFRFLLAFASMSAVGRLYMESMHIVEPLTTSFSKPLKWSVNEATASSQQQSSMGVVRGAIVYLPKEGFLGRKGNDRLFVDQAKWFLRSWEETRHHLNSFDRIDVLIVVSDDTLAKAQEVLHRWDCQPTIRRDRNQPSACRLIPGFVPLHERENEVLSSYRFANSIDCVLHAASRKAVEGYDKILRTDLDTFLTPRFAKWMPEKFIVGQGAFCYPQFDTCNRLHTIADRLGLTPTNASAVVDNIGSTWYGDPVTMIYCSQTSMDVMRYLWEYEFNATEDKEKRGWPHWFSGVTSMYAGNIAINYCAGGNVGFEKRADIIDFPSTSDESTWEAVHIHTWQNTKDFSKLVYRDGGYKHTKVDGLNLNVTRDYAMFMALDGNRKDKAVDARPRHQRRKTRFL